MKRGWDIFVAFDRRIIFLFVFLTILVPLVFPFALPVRPTAHVRHVFEGLERAARARKPVLLTFDFDPLVRAEMEPAARAMLRQVFAQGGRAVITGALAGMSLHEQIIADCAQEYGAVYGRDYVYLGFQPGGTALIINMGQDFVSAYPRDAYGTDIRTLDVARDVFTLRDFDYVMVFSTSLNYSVQWINLGQGPYNLRMGSTVMGVLAPDLYNYLDSGQLSGLLGGLVGVAQYEQILKDDGVYLVRRFSPQDLVRSRLPALCAQLTAPQPTAVAGYIWSRLDEGQRAAVRATVARRADQLGPADKRAITLALNEAVTNRTLITDQDLAGVQPAREVAALLDRPHVAPRRPDVLRRLYVENLFGAALVRAQSDAQAVRWMTPQSVTHLVLIAAIIFGNVAFFVERARRRRGGAAEGGRP